MVARGLQMLAVMRVATIALALLPISACTSCEESELTDSGDSQADAAASSDAGAQVSCSGPIATDVEIGDAWCIIDDGGRAICRGTNLYGQLGRGFVSMPGEPPLPPDVVPGLSDVTDLAAGDGFLCAMSSGGAVSCAGRNGLGQLGDGAIGNDSSTMVQAIASGATSIEAGRFAACATRDGSQALCWGYDLASRMVGNDQVNRPSPVADVRFGSAPSAVGIGEQVGCGLGNGQLGCGSFLETVPGQTGFSTVLGAGVRHLCASRADGGLQCWGQNFDGQLGDQTTTDSRAAAVTVAGLTDVVAMSGGWHHSCALRSDGTVWCWGGNDSGQLGRGFESTRELVPEPVPGLTDIVAIDSGYYINCAVDTAGSVRCWGGLDWDDPTQEVYSPKCMRFE